MITALNDLVIAVVVVARIGLSILFRTHKGRKMNIVAVVVVVVSAVEVTIYTYPSSLLTQKKHP